MRPIIRPGLQVLRRDVHTLQLGRDWPGLGYVTDSPALRAVLAAIDGFRDVAAVVRVAATTSGTDPDQCAAALDVLIDAGAVVDQSATRRPGCSEELWASLWLMAGPTGSAREVLAQRRACRAHVLGDGPIADVVRDLLPRAQVPVTERLAEAAVVVVTATSEPPRELSDQAMRTGLPHVWAHARDLVGVVGPFVQPGRSACLRCVDVARAELDPTWATTVAAAAPAVAPLDPVLAGVVGATAAQEVVVWASGQSPQTIDAVLELPCGFGMVERRPQPLHPACGCGWFSSHDTIGA